MESELYEIIKEDYKVLCDQPFFIPYLDKLFAFYTNKREETKQRMLTLFDYYNDTKRANFLNPPKYARLKNIYPHILLNKEPGQYEITVFLDYDGGICQAEEAYIALVDDPEIHPTEYAYMEDEDFDVHTYILVTWLAHLWQEIDGNKYGMVVKFDEHGLSYFLNDHTWDDDSKYQNVHEIKNYKTGSEKYSVLELYKKVKQR